MEDFDDLGLTLTSRVVYNEKAGEINTLKQRVYELDIQPEEWIKRMKELYKYDLDAACECISDFASTYAESGVSSLRGVCEMILREPSFDFLSRYKCAEVLGNLWYMLELLQNYQQDPKDDINFTLFSEQLMSIIYYLDFPDDTVESLCEWIFTTKTVHWGTKYKLFKQCCDFRVKSTSMLNKLGKVLISNNILCNFTVLCLQLVRFDDKTLKSILTRVKTHKDVKVKADVLDNMLNYPGVKKEALALLKAIGEGMKTLDSSQNVHMVNTDVDKWLEGLARFDPDKYTYDSIVSELKEEWDRECTPEEMSSIAFSFQRIDMDNNLYGKSHYRLKAIFMRVYTKIQIHEYKAELMGRLKQELIEMSSWCSSGHLHRLINIFSGYEDATTIDPTVELRSVINKRVEKHMDTLKGKYEVRKVNKGKFKFAKRIDADQDLDEDIKRSLHITETDEAKEELDEKAIEEDTSMDLYDKVMEAWMDGDEAILQQHFYPKLAEIHDEVYADYVGQGIMNPQEFTQSYRDIVNNLFVVA